MRRRSFCLSGFGLVALFACGCDDAGSLKEGVPQDVDMTKSYTPNIEMPGMSKKQAAEANKKKAAPASK